MLYELSKELGASLQARGVPLKVVFGPERTQPVSASRERIVLEHLEGGDSFGPLISQHRNPRGVMTRRVAAVLRIYAQATISGAGVQDHRRRAEAVLDQVIVALDDIARGSRRNQWSPASGGFVVPEDSVGSETWSGACYEMRFSIDRSVLDTTWTDGTTVGSGLPEATIGGDGGVTIASRTEVRLANGPDDADPETACGG